ncbi:protein of unknown function [Methylacidimicrobium sp. AP8]|uniref:hypothetical protein n=1 Tax=Methylacidimicrobium sp. AP8 TaxID=2730359 RepID=UPI0018C0CD11|nr:hypothetical protein [Methylacidimicrobium sp. AP8]CAB4244373.1 protein of unknown function [Methylacidimicrobium sp. AP8]
MNLTPLTGFRWQELERRDPNRVEPNAEGRPVSWRKHFLERQQTPQFWAELRDYHKDRLEEAGLLEQVERLARHRSKGKKYGPGLINPQGIPYSLHHRVPGSLAGEWKHEQINHVGNLLVIPGRAHSAFDDAIYAPVTEILKPGQKIWVPTAERESLSFYDRFNGRILSLEEELRPLEAITKNPAPRLATTGLKARELPGVAKENPRYPKLREMGRKAPGELNKLISRTAEQFKSLTGEAWRHLLPERESLLGRAGALLRGSLAGEVPSNRGWPLSRRRRRRGGSSGRGSLPKPGGTGSGRWARRPTP